VLVVRVRGGKIGSRELKERRKGSAGRTRNGEAGETGEEERRGKEAKSGEEARRGKEQRAARRQGLVRTSVTQA